SHAALETADEALVREVARRRLAQEPLEARPGVGVLRSGDGARRQLTQVPAEHGDDELLLRREAAEDRPVADAGTPRDLVDADVEAALGEALAGHLEQPVVIALRVGPERHAPSAGCARAAAWMRSTSRRRRRTVSTTRPASTKPPPAANAQWKPCTSGPFFDASLVTLAATVERIASPRAPPICCDVLKMPDARPWSESARPVVATSVSTTKTKPIPNELSRIGGSTSATYVPCTGSRVRRYMPAAVISMPPLATSRASSFDANCDAIPAETMIPAVKGRNARPALSGPYPSTCWMERELKKNIAKRPDATSSIAMFAAVSERTRKMPRRTSGATERRSTRTNATRSAIAARNSPIVRPDVQPCPCAFTIANTSVIRPAVAQTAPATSKLRCASSSTDSGMRRSERMNVAAPTGTLMKKIQGHESSCVSTPPSTSPTAEPPDAIAAQTPSAFARSLPSANVVEMIESAAGEMNAAPSPCKARKPISMPEFTASPFRSEAVVNTTTPARNSRLRPRRSPARPPSSRKPPKSSA